MKSTKDGQLWKRWVTSSRKFFKGARQTARCQGSAIYASNNCPFLNNLSSLNRMHFRMQSGVQVCFTCGSAVGHIECHAVQVWEYGYGNSFMTIMHNGNHTCRVKAVKFCHQIMQTLVRENPSVESSKLTHEKNVAADDQ